MCGIAGIAKNKGEIAKKDDLVRMCDAILRRGPDDSGYFFDNNIALGMRRLKVIDLAGGHQPMTSQNGRYSIVYNGEVFNYIEIRKELIARGRSFKTNSDTEVVLQAYEEYGERAIQHFRGMFAFSIFDKQERTLCIVRDRLGIKPLYYYDDGTQLLFASEMKSLVPFCKKKTINNEAILNYLTFSYIPAPLSIYEEIKKLDAGHLLKWKDGAIQIEQYWDVDFSENDLHLSEEELAEQFEALLTESIQLRMRSDVPLGVFLSGGIDSGLLTALMAQHSTQKVKTFTIGFPAQEGEDERVFSKEIATFYDTEHHEFELSPNMVDLIPEIVSAFDEPFGDVSVIPTYIVSKMAKKHVTVALSGLGGDELFAGYERHLGFLLSARVGKYVPKSISKSLSAMASCLPELSKGNNRISHIKRFLRALPYPESERYLKMISLLPEKEISDLVLFNSGDYQQKIKSNFASFFDRPEQGNPLSQVLYADTKQYLPDDILCNTDRLSMWHSLEVRVPFLDHQLIEYCAKLPSKMKINGLSKKYLLKKVASKYLSSRIIGGKKKGFICPMSEWLKNDLKDMCYDVLQSEAVKTQGIFNSRKIGEILDDHFKNRALNDTLIWSMLIFQSWHEN